MGGAFIVSLMLFLIQLSSTNSLEFEISRNLNSLDPLDSQYTSSVEIIDDCDENNNITVIVKVPKTLTQNFPNVTVFFANELKNILEVELKEAVKGFRHSTPFRVEKEIDGGKTDRTEPDDFRVISGKFPRTWLPLNTTKVSGTVRGDHGTYYNYYGTINFHISIADLLVVEEYRNYKCGS